ncbi:beta-N-acetylhexosaminidase, partial [Streptomyces sioyaensis]|uniref:beta-N-acetylhexosaminidase n=1 Tax=Streptomyces sioyaensis TaxID=67364 RepID=UPI0033DFE857
MRRRRLLCSLLLVAATGMGTAAAQQGAAGAAAPAAAAPLDRVVPAPASVHSGRSTFTLGDATRIRVPGGSGEAKKIAGYLAGLLRPATGYDLPVTTKGGGDGIVLRLGGPGTGGLGAEGYRLTSGSRAVILSAARPAGLFHGVQTLRQLLPPDVERQRAARGPWRIAGGTITDAPRYAYRGAMLDVSRHFF